MILNLLLWVGLHITANCYKNYIQNLIRSLIVSSEWYHTCYQNHSEIFKMSLVHKQLLKSIFLMASSEWRMYNLATIIFLGTTLIGGTESRTTVPKNNSQIPWRLLPGALTKMNTICNSKKMYEIIKIFKLHATSNTRLERKHTLILQRNIKLTGLTLFTY